MLNSIPELVSDLRQGRIVVVVDAADRENEGDLVASAQMVTPEIVNFMITHGRGLVCMPITAKKAQMLGLRPMVEDNQSHFSTAFTQSIGAKEGITTGISAQDRAHTMRVASHPSCGRESIVSPGHVFPLIGHERGVLARGGHTEASIELMRLADLEPAAVICEVLDQGGTPARLPNLLAFAKMHRLKIGSIEDLVAFKTQAATSKI